MDASLKTHCHYELVDMQRFCHLIQFTLIHFGYTRHLVLATDRKWMKHIHDIILSFCQNEFDIICDYSDAKCHDTVSS